MANEQDTVRKIQGLLAKAQATDIKAEADAFFAKAEELMLRYAIDEARVRQFVNDRDKESKPIMEVYAYSTTDNNAVGKMRLMHAVADGHRVQMILAPDLSSKRLKQAYLVGYRVDVEFVKVLYTSLLVQAQREATIAWRGGDGKSAFVTSFLGGFAHIVRKRLMELHAEMVREDPTGMALVDLSKQRVADAVKEFVGRTKQSSVRSGNGGGWYAGANAGAKADIGLHRMGSGAKSIGSGR